MASERLILWRAPHPVSRRMASTMTEWRPGTLRTILTTQHQPHSCPDPAPNKGSPEHDRWHPYRPWRTSPGLQGECFYLDTLSPRPQISCSLHLLFVHLLPCACISSVFSDQSAMLACCPGQHAYSSSIPMPQGSAREAWKESKRIRRHARLLWLIFTSWVSAGHRNMPTSAIARLLTHRPSAYRLCFKWEAA